MTHPVTEKPDTTLNLDEIGLPQEGAPQTSNKRLFIQLQVFGNCKSINALTSAISKHSISSAVYLDANDPLGVGIVSLSEKPDEIVQWGRMLATEPFFPGLVHKPEFTMLGRTYAAGREADLEDWLLKKPIRNIFNPSCKWAVWYPLRRKPEFNLLPKRDQGTILKEHGMIGYQYGKGGHAYDVRLACHGLDKNDNDFVIGIVSPELHIISKLVQRMRETQQTGKYMDSLGPFFVGQFHFGNNLAQG